MAALKHGHGGGDDGCSWGRKKAGEGEGEKDLGQPRVSAVLFLSTRRTAAMRGGEEASWCDCEGELVIGCARMRGLGKGRPKWVGPHCWVNWAKCTVHFSHFPFPLRYCHFLSVWKLFGYQNIFEKMSNLAK